MDQMLKNAQIVPYIPVADVARARKFYEEKVGLKPKEEYAGGVIYECGSGSWVFVYPSAGAARRRPVPHSGPLRTSPPKLQNSKREGWYSRSMTCQGSRWRTASLARAVRKLPGSRIARGISWP